MAAKSVSFKQTVNKMVASLLEEADHCDVDISGITLENWQTYLDDQFDDGGEARCEKFADLAWDYSFQFGKVESNLQMNAQWKCLEAAVKQLVEHFNVS